MASVLSLRPESPFKRSFSDNPYLSSYPPLKDNTFNALRAIATRNVSACSLYTIGAIGSGEWLNGGENTPPSLTSRSLLELNQLAEQQATGSCDYVRRKQSYRSRPSATTLYSEAVPIVRYQEWATFKRTVHENRRASSDNLETDSEAEDQDFFALYDAIHIPLPQSESHDSDCTGHEDDDFPPFTEPPSLKKWISMLRRRHIQAGGDADLVAGRGPDKCVEHGTFGPSPSVQVQDVTCGQALSDSGSSSMGCITAVRSASMTITSSSHTQNSERTGFQTRCRLAKRSSTFSEVRRSTDSNTLGPILDESAWLRALQRRKVVEELLASEESYIADLKVLINDYFTILSTVSAISSQTRASIQQNICQILQLHEELLADLHNVIPQADFTQSVAHQEAYAASRAKHTRFHSADLMPGRVAEYKVARRLRHSLEIGRSPERRANSLVTDTYTAGNIAKVFNKHMRRFFTYEEYGAHWTTMSQDLATLCKGFPGWTGYERGVEALNKLVASDNNRDLSSRKALGFSDLLIKPIQRVCKYPLLFDDLCRQTPVYDDPEAHAELEKALFRLQETIREVNKAKDDPKTRRLIEISWQLQDRLAFPPQNLSRALISRLLGHVLVCGVLHVAFQSPDRVKGQYMICILYKSCLVLATPTRCFAPYNVLACISLANASVEQPDNGRGLQCHTAPHTWKLIFEHGHRLNEIILSACSPQEEEVWKEQLKQRIVSETHDFVDGHAAMQELFSSLALDMKSIGPVFGHADSLVRRMSVHRAATLGSKTTVAQVIIKNTQAQKLPEVPPPFSPPVARSLSHMSHNHVPTLAPRRAERVRLETSVEDVWTKDILPFPGMSNRRVEDHIRASANSVMRKLSMASIASNFSRRSPSFSSISNARSDESFGSRVHKAPGNTRSRSAAEGRSAPALVDFHNAPAAFLPTDFEIQDSRPSSRRRRLANRAVGGERSSERFNEKYMPAIPKRARRFSNQPILPRTDIPRRVDSLTTCTAMEAAILQQKGATATRGILQENENQRNVHVGRPAAMRAASADLPTRKFLKSKSKIFKFWM
ncbi:hypothetical protein M011DRAFT_523497 [Sporormia fimetaria CBS 119925]|uniref:DH domain-containing protein n=1 Tax=Sporormia fimetaria CBS 119925 TaxID=1340428 RepID=A0A6A6VLQ6_9PLEO|nr:hypothetical protein M011DRAFT_523497 [Sporormia fimetaria CBS 119925]